MAWQRRDGQQVFHPGCAGAYNLLPAAIEELRGPKLPPAGAKRLAAVQLLNHWLRVQLLKVGLLLLLLAGVL